MYNINTHIYKELYSGNKTAIIEGRQKEWIIEEYIQRQRIRRRGFFSSSSSLILRVVVASVGQPGQIVSTFAAPPSCLCAAPTLCLSALLLRAASCSIHALPCSVHAILASSSSPFIIYIYIHYNISCITSFQFSKVFFFFFLVLMVMLCSFVPCKF